MQEIWMILNTISFRDIIDITFVAIPFYVIFALLREARSQFALWGLISTLVGVSVMYLIAKIFELEATALIYERFWIIVVLLFLIIFQGELKKALSDVGRLRIFRGLFTQEAPVVMELVNAIEHMAERHVGAIIAFERGNSLVPYLGTGTRLDAHVTSDIIRSIFATASPLHDGALIIRGDRLVAAACILPLSENTNIAKDLGTRHRAAIGLTEETDGLVIVVSEETGAISIAEAGKIDRYLETEDLRKRLEEELDIRGELGLEATVG